MTKHVRVAMLVAASLLSAVAGADKLDIRARYEEALVQSALSRLGLGVDPAPEGKLIERVVIVANEIILPGDLPLAGKIPWTWLNHVHVRTRDYIIAQELLFHTGDRLHGDVIDETGRNLRAFFILAVARIAIARGSTPDRVVVVVVTKDNWTLRLNTNFTTDQGRLDSLSLSIAENNLAGRNKTAAINYGLDPGRHSIGTSYVDPRMGGSRVFLVGLAAAYLTRTTGALEGGLGELVVGRDLYSLRTQWGWQGGVTYIQDKIRQFDGGELRQLPFAQEKIPDVYARRQIIGSLRGTRSFGVLDKLNLTLGFRVTSSLYRAPDDFPTATLSDNALAYYRRYVLPYSESASGPYVAAAVYRAAYVRLQNIDTYALSEDFRLGPQASFEVRFADTVFGFDSRFIAFTGNYAATYYGRNDLVALSITGTARLQAGVIAGTDWVNQSVTAGFRNVTPRFGPFRLHLAGALELHRNDLANTQLGLGSDTGLRGFAARAFSGHNFYRANIELRSISANLWTVHVGGVLFYDGGDAPATLATASWHHDVGFGLRILFPQFNKDVLRLDLAFPLERPQGGGYVPRFTASFGQAF